MKTYDIYDNISSILLRMRNVSDKFVDKMKTYFIFHHFISEIQAF